MPRVAGRAGVNRKNVWGKDFHSHYGKISYFPILPLFM